MKLLEANNINIEIQGETLLKIPYLEVQEGDKIGLVGINGAGKTTLMNVLMSQSHNVQHYSTIGLIPQLKDNETTKSGGEITLEYIQDTLSRNPHMLLLDEPTTNLDFTHIEMLNRILKSYKGSYILVSHNKEFLDENINIIWEIEETSLNIYKGNYSNYQSMKKQEKETHKKEYDKYIAKKQQLERAREQKKKQAQESIMIVDEKGHKKETKHFHFQKIGKKLNQVAKGFEKRIEQLQEVEQPEKETVIKMNIPNEETFLGRDVIRFNEVTGSVANRLLWESRPFQIKGGKHVAIIGDNGVGKTTMLKMIQNDARGIEVSPSVIFGYFSQNLDILDEYKTILENIKETSNHDETLIRTVLGRLLIKKDDVNKKVEVLSGGERVIVALIKVFLSNINTLILDEPTNYLDIYRIDALTELLKDYKGTVIFVSHDVNFIKEIANMIVEIKNQQVTIFKGPLDEYRTSRRQQNRNIKEESLMVINNKIAEVLGKLSIEPSDALEQEFNELLKQKRAFENTQID